MSWRDRFIALVKTMYGDDDLCSQFADIYEDAHGDKLTPEQSFERFKQNDRIINE